MALLFLVSCVLLAPQRAAVQPLVGVGVWYDPAPAAGDLEVVRADLADIRRAGFNAITISVTWREAEPERGTYVLAAAERLIAAAAQADLTVEIRLFADSPPAWSSAAAADRERFLAYAAKRLGLQTHVTSVRLAHPGDTTRIIRVGRGGKSPVDARVEFWRAIAEGARQVIFSDADGGAGASVFALGETAGIVTRNQALFGPLRPREGGVRGLTGAAGAPVDVTLLESPDALMIIAVNYSTAVQTITINFAADIPEAIWQNLETGSAVHFVMGKNGPFLEHTFAPRDALVLMIRKTLR